MIYVVGEMWNMPCAEGKFHLPKRPHVHLDEVGDGTIPWSLPYATRAGAFKYGSSRRRLEQTGLRWDQAFNLLPPTPGAAWDATFAARMAGAFMCELLVRDERDARIVALGRRVITAFDKFLEEVLETATERRLDVALTGPTDDTAWFKPRILTKPGRRAAIYPWPHPSGRSREWNDSAVSTGAVTCAKEITCT